MGMNGKKRRKQKIKTPVVLQMEAVECGAASLAIILAYYGRYVSLEELRVECGVTRDGVKVSNIVKAARKYGLECEGYTMETEHLLRLDLPVVVFWDFNHFLVFEGFKKGKFYLNDPASGPRVVSAEEFSESFTGVVLTFSPLKEFQKGGRKADLFSIIGGWLKGSETAVLFFLLLGLLLILPGIVIPVFSKIFIDDILIKRMDNWLSLLILGMLLTAFLKSGLIWLQKKYLLRFEEKLSITSSARLFQHILRLPVTFFSQRYAGEIGSRVALNNEIAQFLARNLAGTILNFIMIGFYAAVMFYYDFGMTLIGILIAALNMCFLYFISRKIKVQKMKLLQERGQLIGNTMSALQIIESLKAGGNEANFFIKYTAYHTKVINSEQRLSLASNILLTVPELLSGINTALILLIGSYRVMNGLMTMGMLIAFQSLMSDFIKPVNSLVQLGGLIQEMKGNAKRIEDVMVHPEDPEMEREVMISTAPVPPKLTGSIEIRDMVFGYGHRDNRLLKGVSLSLSPGSRVAVIGRSGSGKTTLGRLICGLFNPWEGEILFDGIPRQDIPRAVLNSSIAAVDYGPGNLVNCAGSLLK